MKKKKNNRDSNLRTWGLILKFKNESLEIINYSDQTELLKINKKDFKDFKNFVINHKITESLNKDYFNFSFNARSEDALYCNSYKSFDLIKSNEELVFVSIDYKNYHIDLLKKDFEYLSYLLSNYDEPGWT